MRRLTRMRPGRVTRTAVVALFGALFFCTDTPIVEIHELKGLPGVPTLQAQRVVRRWSGVAVVEAQSVSRARVRRKSPTPGSGSQLFFHVNFDGLSQDYWQRPNGTVTPNWYDNWQTSGLFPLITDGVGGTTPVVQPTTNNITSGVTEPKGSGILLAAGRSGQAGDRGFRPAWGPGVNTTSSKIYIRWDSNPQRELWLKWDQRYPTGLHPTSNWVDGVSETGNGAWSYNKDLALNNDNNPNDLRIEIGQSQGSEAPYFGSWGMQTTDDGSNHYPANLYGTAPVFTWATAQGGATGSGNWDTYQVHVKADTGVFDGVYEAWFNGTKIAEHFDVRFSGGNGSHTGWRSLMVSNNQRAPGTDSTAFYSDYDNIKGSIVGLIP